MELIMDETESASSRIRSTVIPESLAGRTSDILPVPPARSVSTRPSGTMTAPRIFPERIFATASFRFLQVMKFTSSEDESRFFSMEKAVSR